MMHQCRDHPFNVRLYALDRLSMSAVHSKRTRKFAMKSARFVNCAICFDGHHSGIGPWACAVEATHMLLDAPNVPTTATCRSPQLRCIYAASLGTTCKAKQPVPWR